MMKLLFNAFSIKFGISIFLLVIAIGSCAGDKNVDRKKDVAVYTWLVGEWNSSLDPAIWEIWESDSVELNGVSFRIIGKDSTMLEKMKIKWQDTILVFIADVPENPTSVEFYLTEKKANLLHFENPKHDFPKEISYKKIGSNSILAEIKGDHKSIEYLFIRR